MLEISQLRPFAQVKLSNKSTRAAAHVLKQASDLLGRLLVAKIQQAAMSRSDVVEEDRRDFYLYVDEFQDFAAHPGQAQTFSQMLSQVRKFGLHMILANQSIAQWPFPVQDRLRVSNRSGERVPQARDPNRAES